MKMVLSNVVAERTETKGLGRIGEPLSLNHFTAVLGGTISQLDQAPCYRIAERAVLGCFKNLSTRRYSRC